MTDRNLPVGAIREKALAESLAALRRVAGRKPLINDSGFTDLAQVALDIVALHESEPRATLADDLENLLAALREIPMPEADDDAVDSYRDMIERVEGWNGSMRIAVDRVKDAAKQVGLEVSVTRLPEGVSALAPRSAEAVLLSSLAHRLRNIERTLDNLRKTAPPGDVVQQSGLLPIYLKSMRVELNLAKLEIGLGGKTVDLGALSRAAEAMAELTKGFVATVHALRERVATTVTQVTESARKGVRRFVGGVRTQLNWISRSQRQTRLDPGPPPSDFYIGAVREMILRGEPPPSTWKPWITELFLYFRTFTNLSPLAGLTDLQVLNLDSTQVTDLSPITRLKKMQRLYLNSTPVDDLSAISDLTELEVLYLNNTQVTDLSALAGLTKLEVLYLNSTHVTDLSPLTGLTNLQWLYLSNTRVTDVSALSGLKSLQRLHLGNTQVKDLSALAGLRDLVELDLDKAPIANLSPVEFVPILTRPDGTRK